MSGSRTTKRVPASRLLVTEIFPPWLSTMPLAMASPSPKPPVSLARALSER